MENNDLELNKQTKNLKDNSAEKKFSLEFEMGRNEQGEMVTGDLAEMGHLLIAGCTGSGKSVFLHNMILNLAQKYSTDDLELILVDTKHTEFGCYKNLPCAYLCKDNIELFEYYKNTKELYENLIGEYKNIDEYNKSAKVKNGETQQLPHIVIIVDEFIILLSNNKREYEELFANMKNDLGIHFVLATQNPNGLTKKMINSFSNKISFYLYDNLAKKFTGCLDAETLNRSGEMLFYSENSKQVRLQGNYISEKQIKNGVTGVIKKDKYLGRAMEIFFEKGDVCAEYLQETLNINEVHAYRIIYNLYSLGYVSDFEDEGNAKVLLTLEQFKNNFGEDFSSE